MTSAHTSIIPEFIEKIDMMKVQADFRITKDEITNLKTGSSILFKGIRTSSGNQTASLKSLNGVTTFVVDEAEELTDEKTFDKIDFSIRSKTETNRVILVMNPSTKEHWIYKRFFLGYNVNDGSNTVEGDCTFIHTTYKDNKDNLSESFLNQIYRMKRMRPDKYQQQILGGWKAKADGVIITNWSVGAYQDLSHTVYGQDFGFSEDPTTLVKVSVDLDNYVCYVKEIFTEKKLTATMIAKKNYQECGMSLIVCDSAEPRLIQELKRKGLNLRPAVKKQGSILSGISLMRDFKIIVDPTSENIIKEFNNYVWHEKGEKPIDKYNHCFVGDTIITTDKGGVKIKDIKVGDKVLTSKGYKRVLKTFSNGKKRVNNYSMQFGTNIVDIQCTDSHKFKTTEGWKEVKELQKGMKMYRHKPLMEKHTTYTKGKSIFQKVLIGYIELYGSTIKERYQKATTFITSMGLLQIMRFLTCLLLMEVYILGLKLKRGLKKTLNLLKSFTQKVLRLQKNGINQKKVENGIVNTTNTHLEKSKQSKEIVMSVEKSMKPNILNVPDSVITTVKLNQIDVTERQEQEVYDIMVEDCHEYFANGVLVHNCIDAIRYALMFLAQKRNKGIYHVK